MIDFLECLLEVALVDFNCLMCEAELPRITESLLQEGKGRDDMLMLFVLPATCGASKVETLLLPQLAALMTRRVVIQTSKAPPWAEGATLLHMLVVCSGNGWASVVSARLTDLFQKCEVDFTPALVSANRHVLGSGRCWRKAFYKLILKIFNFTGETSEIVFLQADCEQGQFMEVLFEQDASWKYSYVGGVPSTQSGRHQALQGKVQAHVHAQITTSRQLTAHKSDTDTLLSSIADKSSVLELARVMKQPDQSLQDFFQKGKSAAQKIFESMSEEFGFDPWTQIPDVSDTECPVILADSRKFAEQKAVRKCFARAQEDAETRLPKRIRLFKSLLTQQLMLYPSAICDGSAVFPTRHFQKGDAVMTVTGKWGQFQASRAQ